MKCRTCGNELEVRQTETGKVAICHTCKTKRKLRKKEIDNRTPSAPPQSYSNIPEEKIRKKSEREVKQNYQQMLDAGGDNEMKRKPRKKSPAPRKTKQRKKKRPVLTILIVILLLAVLGAAVFFGYRFYRDNLAGTAPSTQTTDKDKNEQTDTVGSDSINVSTADFSIEYLEHKTGIDQSGAPCLLLYYIYTNNRKEASSNALSDVRLTAAQNGSDCADTTPASPPEEAANMTADAEYNQSVTVCQAFTLSDTSEVTISVTNLLDNNGTILGRQVFQP